MSNPPGDPGGGTPDPMITIPSPGAYCDIGIGSENDGFKFPRGKKDRKKRRKDKKREKNLDLSRSRSRSRSRSQSQEFSESGTEADGQDILRNKNTFSILQIENKEVNTDLASMQEVKLNENNSSSSKPNPIDPQNIDRPRGR